MKQDILERLVKYFDGETVEYFATDEALEENELLDLLCRAAEGALNDGEEREALADCVWAEEQLAALYEEPRELSPEYQAAELPQEVEMFNFVEHMLSGLFHSAQPAADPPPREFAPAPPVKEHAPTSEQLDLACAHNSPKETAQALEIKDQDRGGIPRPDDYIEEYIAEMKQEVAEMEAKAVVVLEVGQRFMAPPGYKIKEKRLPTETFPDGQLLFYGSIFKGRKLNNELKGSKFSLTPRS